MITLPDSHGPAESVLRRVTFGVVRQNELGGAAQRIDRTGDRWAVDITLPPMVPADARRWHAALTAAVREGAKWRLRQVDLSVSVGNAVRVAGADQLGMALDVDGMRAGGGWPAGAMVSVITGGRGYLHQLAVAGAAASDGTAELALNEMLRVSPADNAVVDFAPSIEGLINDEAATLSIDRLRLGRASFTITEMR
jgi:hypothetical protein